MKAIHVLSILGLLCIGQAAQAASIITVYDRSTDSAVTTLPSGRTATTQFERNGSTVTATTTLQRNGYQPTGASGYQPMGNSGYKPMGR